MGTEADPNFTVAASPVFPPFRQRVLESPLPFVTILSPAAFMTLEMVSTWTNFAFLTPWGLGV
jgi:hypothetical protein